MLSLSVGPGHAPPELCGGVTGHVDLVDVLRSPNHSRHAEVSRWLEATRARYSRDDPRLKRPYDPGAFDLEAANIAIRKLTNSGQET